MSLPSNQLDAFVAVSQKKSFSLAAKHLHITQSALSQRILNLEADLGSTLFLREAAGIRLTELGQRLLRFCLAKDSLEEEFIGTIKNQSADTLHGIIKLGGFSTIVRSILIPSMNSLIVKNPNVQINFLTREIAELSPMLDSGEVDYIFSNRPYERQGVENLELGFEEYVLVEPKSGQFRENVFLDHDENDKTTEDFFKYQSRPIKSYSRCYLDEIYSIMDGVVAGLGRAVIPLHLAKQFDGLIVSKGFKTMKVPVYFSYYQQTFYTALQKQVIDDAKKKVPKLLVRR